LSRTGEQHEFSSDVAELSLASELKVRAKPKESTDSDHTNVVRLVVVYSYTAYVLMRFVVYGFDRGFRFTYQQEEAIYFGSDVLNAAAYGCLVFLLLASVLSVLLAESQAWRELAA